MSHTYNYTTLSSDSRAAAVHRSLQLRADARRLAREGNKWQCTAIIMQCLANELDDELEGKRGQS